MKKLCDYGCGREATTQFKNGKWCCENNYLKCPNISSLQRLRTVAIKINDLNKICSYGCNQKANYFFIKCKKYCCSKYLQSCPSIRIKNSEANKIKQSGENNAMFGKKQTKESIEKNRESNKRNWSDPNSKFDKEKWKRNFIRSMNKRPNNLESFLLKILNENLPGRYKYTGDFKFWIGRKNSDFVNEKDKRVIEFFGNYFHNQSYTGISNIKHEKDRIEYFKKYNYSTLIIWEDELNNIEQLIDKIKKFDKGE